jgi:hypothetical protein
VFFMRSFLIHASNPAKVAAPDGIRTHDLEVGGLAGLSLSYRLDDLPESFYKVDSRINHVDLLFQQFLVAG